MTSANSPAQHLIATLQPVRHEGVFVYCQLERGSDLSVLDPIGTFREQEGITVIVKESQALRARLPILFRAAWITLTVDSSLEAVGLTQAFSAALAEAAISCNVVAGASHDHLFVPIGDGDRAMDVLRELQRSAQSSKP